MENRTELKSDVAGLKKKVNDFEADFRKINSLISQIIFLNFMNWGIMKQ